MKCPYCHQTIEINDIEFHLDYDHPEIQYSSIENLANSWKQSGMIDSEQREDIINRSVDKN